MEESDGIGEAFGTVLNAMRKSEAEVEARVWEQAAAFCRNSPGLTLNESNALEFDKRARVARERISL